MPGSGKIHEKLQQSFESKARVVLSPFVVAMLVICGLAVAQVAAAQMTPGSPVLVGSTSGPLPVLVAIHASGSNVQVSTSTGGQTEAALQEFLASSVTCPNNSSVNQGQTCQVDVTFSPLYPGLRQGAVLIEANGVLLGSAFVSGVGQGSLPVLEPGDINTVAGDGELNFAGDGVKGPDAAIWYPNGLAVDAAGTLFFCDSLNNRIRRVDAVTKLISTVAGNGTSGSGGDGGQATAAQLNRPSGLAMDGAGNLYVADTGNQLIRRIDAITGVITTIAGQVGMARYSGEGLATSATLSAPEGLAISPGGSLLIADSDNNRVRSINLASGQITTIAGTGAAGPGGDEGPATSAQLSNPFGLAVRSDGAIALADQANQVVRLIDTAGVIHLVAGTYGTRGFTGDSTSAIGAKLDTPAAVAFDPAGDLFIADSGNNRVRGVFGTAGIITTVVGNGSTAASFEVSPSDQASLYTPYALVFDSGGNLWISDLSNNRVREVSGSKLSHTFPTIKVGNLSTLPYEGTLYNAGNSPLLLQPPAAGAGLVESVLDVSTTTCSASPIAPTVFCAMGIKFAPTRVNTDDLGSVTWNSNALLVVPVDALDAEVLDVEPTAMALSSNANPGVFTQSITLTGAVTLTSTGSGSGLTGNVTFSEGSASLCATPSGVSPDGLATCSISTLALGVHSITATYSGDPNNAPSTSLPFLETIKQISRLALLVSSNPATVTNAVTLSVGGLNSGATGAVTFYDGGSLLGTVTLGTSGVAQWTQAFSTVGTHSLSAQYSGDGKNGSGSSNSVSEQITQSGTQTVLSSNTGDPVIDTALILTAKVAAINISSVPTGTVQFSDGVGAGAIVIGTGTLDATGTATLSLSTLQPGAHSLIATYEGDPNDSGSSSTNALSELVQATGMALGSSLNPAVRGVQVVLTAQLEASGPVAPSGVAVFRDGGALLAGSALSSAGSASIATSNLSVGTHVLTVSYAGDEHHVAVGGLLTEVIITAATTTQLAAGSANPVTYGQPFVLTATVTSNGGGATGTVTFLNGTTVLGSAPLGSDGVAVFTLTTLNPGSDSVTASYGGDENAHGSVSAPVAVVVKQATTLAVSAGANPALTLSAITLTASVFNAGAAPATGSVIFTDGGATLGAASVDSSGHASLLVPKLARGTHEIVATYGGDADDLGSASTSYSLVVQLRQTQTDLTASATDTANPQQVTLIAVVRGEGSVPPSGIVVFSNAGLTLGQGSVDATGVATITVILSQTSQQIAASYSGDSSYAASSSGSESIDAGTPAQFTLTSPTPNITLVTHQHTSMQIVLGSVHGFTDTISLGCLGLPYAATCTFTPSQLKLSADGSAQATLILDTGNPLGAGSGTNTAMLRGTATRLCWLPLGLLAGFPRPRRRNVPRTGLSALLLIALGCGLVVGVSGCSGLQTSGTPPGTYQFKVVGTGQGSGTTQVQNITLVVTP